MNYVLGINTQGGVSQPESKTREYKQDLSSPEKAMRAIVAFANSAGGQLVIGVTDDCTVVGVEDPLLEQERLTNLIADWVSPQLIPTIELVPLTGTTVVIADVAVSIRRPHFLTRYGKEEGTYIRLGASNRKAGPDIIAELERVTAGIEFDKLPAFRATMDDLDTATLAKQLGRDVDERTLKTLELVIDDQGHLTPTNAGILVASPYPERFFPFAYVQCARFRGPTKRDIWDQEEIYGPLPLAVDKVMRFLEQNAFLHAEFGDIYRKDVWSIPMAPLREFVTNALVHASYSRHGVSIKVAFLDHTIEIENPGGLMPDLTVEEMLQGMSMVRNRAVARVFKESGLIEQWGTGIPQAVQRLADAGLPAPEFKEFGASLRVIVHIEDHSVTPRQPQSEQPIHLDTLTGVQVYKSGAEVPSSASTILRLVTAAPARRSDLLAALGITQSPNNYIRHIRPLVEAGLLALTIPDKPSSSQQRYLITEAGREWLSTQEADDVHV